MCTASELWTPAAVVEQDFMERYVVFNLQVMNVEPIDILANATFPAGRHRPQLQCAVD